jgi:hypothetical protein
MVFRLAMGFEYAGLASREGQIRFELWSMMFWASAFVCSGRALAFEHGGLLSVWQFLFELSDSIREWWEDVYMNAHTRQL